MPDRVKRTLKFANNLICIDGQKNKISSSHRVTYFVEDSREYLEKWSRDGVSVVPHNLIKKMTPLFHETHWLICSKTLSPINSEKIVKLLMHYIGCN